MPRVETFQGDRVRTAPIAGTKRSAVPTPQVFGANIGEAVGLAAQAASRIQAEAKQRADDLALIETEKQANQLDQIYLYANDRGETNTHGLLNRVGLDPMERAEDATKEYDEQWDEMLKAAKNPEQRVRMEALRNQRRRGFSESVAKHASVQLKAHETGQINGLLASSRNTAIAAAGSVNAIEAVTEQLQRQGEIIDVHGAKLGLTSQEAKDAYRAQLRSDTHVGVLERMMATGRDLAAEDYFRKVTEKTDLYPEGQIAGEKLGPLEERLTRNTREGQAFRVAQDIWGQHGPAANDDDSPIQMDKMQDAARAASGGDPKLYAQIKANLDDRAGGRASAVRERESTRKSTLWGGVTAGQSYEQIRRMPEFAQADGTTQHDLQRWFVDEAERKANRLEAAESRAYQRQQREDAKRERDAWGLRWQLSQNLADMNEGDIVSWYRTLGPQHVEALLDQKRRQDADRSTQREVTIDRDQFEDIALQAGLTYAKETPANQTPEQKERLGRLHAAVMAEIDYQQGPQGKGRKLTWDEKNDVMRKIVDQKVMVKGFWSDRQEIAATMRKNEVGKFYVPVDEMKRLSPGDLKYMVDVIKGFPARAGTQPTRDLKDEEIIARYKDQIQRAYGAALSGQATDAEVRAILQGKD